MRTNVHDDERSGRPSTSQQPDYIAAVQASVDKISPLQFLDQKIIMWTHKNLPEIYVFEN